MSSANLNDPSFDMIDMPETVAGAENDGPDGGLASPHDPAPSGRERRQHSRREYGYTQLIAPLVNGKMPDKNSFASVFCHDISRGGFSFISATIPPANTYVVELGQGPQTCRLVAEVVHANRTKGGYLIGCQFVGRAFE